LHVNIRDVAIESVSEGVTKRTLLQRSGVKGQLLVLHHTLLGGKVTFRGANREFQHYIISGSGLYRGKYVHGDTSIFVPGNTHFGEINEHEIVHSGEGELRILSAIYCMSNPNFKWAKPRIKNLNEVEATYSGMIAHQLFTEEEHMLMGARRMHSVEVQTHSPSVLLPIHRNPEEFGYILRGEGVVESGTSKYRVSPGSLVYTPEGEPHSILNTSDNLPLQYVAFEFTEQDKSLKEMGNQPNLP
jgi:mannose-6-phosphate isomerase-like protein (cupin superfamily)